jgi:hypothetical protein
VCLIGWKREKKLGKKRKVEGKHKFSIVWLGKKLGKKLVGNWEFSFRAHNFFSAQFRQKITDIK